MPRTAQEQFDQQASHYNGQWNSWSEHTLKWMLAASQASSKDQVLDIATGTGFTALAFAPHVASVIGLDVSTGMLAEARARAEEQGISNVGFHQGAADALPFEDNSFEIVTCRIAAHHFPDVPAFLRETARVLKPGGRFLLVDTTIPDADPEAGAWQNAVEAVRDPSHIHNWTPNEWKQMTTAAGMQVEMVTATGAGIKVPLEDWLTKAGCSEKQSEEVRQRFHSAPAGAQEAFQIVSAGSRVSHFTWQRVLLKAVKQQVI
jgi:ubiquinone/menaquinone biosynthesis C-methylase UbiE